MIIGPHLSIAKGFQAAGEEAIKLGASTFQFFTRNPRGGKAKDIDPEDSKALEELMKTHNLGPLLAHAPYTLNLASDKDETVAFARDILKDDLERLKKLPASLYTLHPGSHVGQGVEAGIEKIVTGLNEVLQGNEEVTILLEGMSGKGTEIGKTFEELQAIIEGVTHDHLIGICLDTCHLYSAGYDLVNKLDQVLEDFDDIIGLSRLKALHLNDSQHDIGQHKDRHEKIGQGKIGKEAIAAIVNHPKLREIPFYLETPNSADGYAKEMDLIRDMISYE